MASELLSEFVALLVEKTRSVKRFDFEAFKRLTSIDEANAYVKGRLEFLGAGSSRAVYLLNSRRVLKVARNDFGRQQNSMEAEVSADPASKGIVAQVYDHDRSDKWVVSDLVRPLTGLLEFHQILGGDINFWMFMELVRSGDVEEIPESPARDLAEALVALVDRYSLSWTDVDEISHWGKTADGRVVLLDYGYVDGEE